MTRREFFRSVLPGLRGKNDEPRDDGRKSLQDLFLRAMAQGLDPASHTPEALRRILAERAPKNRDEPGPCPAVRVRGGPETIR